MTRWTPRIALSTLAVLAVASLANAQGPSASFHASPSAPVAGEAVTFTSTSTAGAAALTDWQWDFGDGATAAGEVAEHAFEEGDFVVTLLVTDASGGTGRSEVLFAIVAAPAHDAMGSTLPAWLFWVMPFLVSIILFAMAYLVVAKGQPAIYNQVFLLFYVTSGLKSLSEAALALLAGRPEAGPLELVPRVLAYILLALFLWFVLVFPRPIAPWLRNGRRGGVVLFMALPFLAIDLGHLLPVARSVDLFNVFAVAIAVASLGLLLWHSREIDSQEERLRIRWLAVTFLLLVGSTLALTVLNLLYGGALGDGRAADAHALANLTAITGLVVVPAVEIVGALILLYAILRYQVLGIEGLVLRITRGAVVAITVPSLFIAIGNSVEAIFEATVLNGVKFSFLIAGFISALLMVPLQKWITFLLHRFLPALDRGAEEETQRRREIFEAQLRYCLLDGALKPSEVGTLRKLAKQLAMRRDEMRAILGRFKGADLGGLVELQGKPA